MIPSLVLIAVLLGPGQIAATTGAPAAARPQTVSPEAIAILQSFDARSKTVQDFTADFTHERRTGAPARRVVEKGALKVKRPTKARFDYALPEKRLLVADGEIYSFYKPGARPVMLRNERADRLAAARILSEGRVLERFDCTGEEKDPLGRKFTLAPKSVEKAGGVARIAVVLDASLNLRALEIREVQGSTGRLVLSAVKENVGLKDSEFQLDVPAGSAPPAGLDEKNADAHNNVGAALATEGKLDEAIFHYRSSIALNPNNAATYNNLGAALATQGRLDEAVERFRDAVRLKEGYADAHVNLGLALASLSRYDEAIANYRAAIRIDDGNDGAHSLLASALVGGGRCSQAELFRILAVDRHAADTDEALTLALQKERQPK